MSGIGFVVALPRELPAGFVRIHKRQRVGADAVTLYRHVTAATQLVAVQAGVGRIRAATGARLLVRCFSPRTLVSFGFAGGLAPELIRGSLVIGTALVREDSSLASADVHRALSTQFLAAAKAAGLPVEEGTIVSTPHLVADVAAKGILRENSGACAVDMETAGIVEVAREAGLPWVVVRAIIDSAEHTLPVACMAVLRADGHVAMAPLLRTLCRSPHLLRHFLRLAADAATARRHLAQAFARWTESWVDQRDLEPG